MVLGGWGAAVLRPYKRRSTFDKMRLSSARQYLPLGRAPCSAVGAADGFGLCSDCGLGPSAMLTCSWIAWRSLLSSGCAWRYGPVMAWADSSALKRRYRALCSLALASLPRPL